MNKKAAEAAESPHHYCSCYILLLWLFLKYSNPSTGRLKFAAEFIPLKTSQVKKYYPKFLKY